MPARTRGYDERGGAEEGDGNQTAGEVIGPRRARLGLEEGVVDDVQRDEGKRADSDVGGGHTGKPEGRATSSAARSRRRRGRGWRIRSPWGGALPLDGTRASLRLPAATRRHAADLGGDLPGVARAREREPRAAKRPQTAWLRAAAEALQRFYESFIAIPPNGGRLTR